jgi:DNA polymerase
MDSPAPMAKTMSTAQKTKALQTLAETIRNCSRCPLGSTRIQAVPGEGNVDTEVMFVGEGPGFDEDRQGRPFVGRAGQLLDKMIVAMGLTREKVFIANIAKCHPMIDPLHPEKHGNDRAPNAQEIACCRKYIEQQIAIICPKYVIALGGVAAKSLISDAKSLGALRGQFYDLHLDSVTLPKPVQIIATFHPAALLRNPGWKKDAWTDLQMVMDQLGLKGARK